MRTRLLWSIRSKALRKSNYWIKTTLIVAVFSPELMHQLWIMLKSTCTVHDLGIVPYCFLSIFFSTVGITKSWTTFCNPWSNELHNILVFSFSLHKFFFSDVVTGYSCYNRVHDRKVIFLIISNPIIMITRKSAILAKVIQSQKKSMQQS